MITVISIIKCPQSIEYTKSKSDYITAMKRKIGDKWLSHQMHYKNIIWAL